MKIKTAFSLLLVFLALYLMGCWAQSIYHEPNIAAASAQYFAETAFVKKDIKNSYDLLSDDSKNHFTIKHYEKIVFEMHSGGYPATVSATEYEPMPGQKAMNIFLVGTNENEKFFYRLALQGTAKDGYRVCGLYRGNGPYPQSKLRKKL